MKEKIVKRFYCDFCKKANLQKRAMFLHEKHCTMNPNRTCRLCEKINGGHGKEMNELLEILPDPANVNSITWHLDNHEEYYSIINDFNSELTLAMPKLREATDNCPICIMAALRQKKISVPSVEDFKYKEEVQAVFDNYKSSIFESAY